MTATTKYPCPCCSYLTLDEEPSGTFNICKVCYWEDDNVAFDDPDFAGGANVVSLNTARDNFKKFRASEERWLSRVRPPLPEEIPGGATDVESFPVPSDEAIAAFWKWFATISSRLAASDTDPTLLDVLSKRVSLLGEGLKWEFGPGHTEENAFVISPVGEKRWLAATRCIVERASVLAGWEFHAAKPPKVWNLKFSITGVACDANPWRYVLYAFPDDTYDIVVEQNNVADLRPLAANIVVDGLLGEDVRLEIIGDIEAVHALPEGQEGISIEHLAAHMRSMRTKN
jgi:Cysteine-rich CPCC